MADFVEQYDVVVVGTGAGGLTGAIAAAREGLKVLVIEKAAQWGGTSAWSGGGVWAPANRLQLESGIADSTDHAMRFLDAVVPEEGLATAPERRRAFVEAAPEMVDMLLDLGMGWTVDHDHPDYLSDQPCAGVGRDLDSKFFDANKLGRWKSTMRRGPAPYAIRLKDIPHIGRGISSLKSLSRMAFVFCRHKLMKALGQDPVGSGASLVGQLMAIADRLGVEVRLETPLHDLIVEDGRVVGAIVGIDRRRIAARGGILLAAGGFAHSPLRERLQGMDGAKSSAAPDDTGEIVHMADRIDAMTELMDEAWWGSSFVYPGNVVVFCQWERSLPYSIVVDDQGRRFADEAEDYYSFGKSMIAHGVRQAWLILDARHRKRYTFGGMFPGQTPKAMFDLDFFRTADTLEELAELCGISVGGLTSTVESFNGFARAGVDQDFQRGGEPYDRHWGDPKVKPNPNLGPIEQGPFLATRIYLGDLGTKGGYVTDPNGMVLDRRSRPIEGLYATGNCTASVMGRSYPGPGITLGPAMAFGYISMRHAAKRMTNL